MARRSNAVNRMFQLENELRVKSRIMDADYDEIKMLQDALREIERDSSEGKIRKAARAALNKCRHN